MPASPFTLLEFTPARTSPGLPENAIHLWRIELDRHPVDSCRSLLSQDESERAQRFATETLQRRFSVARASLRRILAGYLPPDGAKPADPEDLIFAYGPNGKPALALDPAREASAPLEFNLSHSDELALLAVCRRPVGIDIEPIRPLANAIAIARRTFPPAVTQELEGLPERDLPQGFFQHWTALEARAKLHGGGIFSDDRSRVPPTLLHLIPRQDWIACLASGLTAPTIVGYQLGPQAQ